MSGYQYGHTDGYQSAGISPIASASSLRRSGPSGNTSISSRQVSPVRAGQQPANPGAYGTGAIVKGAATYDMAERPRYYDSGSGRAPQQPGDYRAYSPSPLAGGAALSATELPTPQDGQAYRDVDNLYSTRMMSPSPDPQPCDPPEHGGHAAAASPPWLGSAHQPSNSQSSIAPLVNQQSLLAPPRTGEGMSAPNAGNADYSHETQRSSYYHGDGYDDPFDPRDIADDGDDGLEEQPRQRGIAAAAAGGATAGAGAGFLKAFGTRGTSGNYGPVSGGQDQAEKSEWLRHQSSGNKRLKWIVGSIVALVVLAAIIGGVVGGVLSRKSSDSGSSTSSSEATSGLWDINSSQIKAVLNNKALSKVFPAMDYTPLNAQYPACLSYKLDQNNVTLDMAILSQLTPAIRLYGTDCNQTEMVLAGIDRLGYNDSMKVWLGVFLGDNSTTNDRQVDQMYDVLYNNDASRFAGVIIGNEAIYEGGMTAADLQTQLTDIRNNLTAKNIYLPISTSQLGDDWTKSPELAKTSDIVMSNIHPFFAGTPAAGGAAWAWTFWQNSDIPLTSATGTIKGTTFPKQIISEIGWPSQGGQDCGDSSNTDTYGCTSPTEGAIASIDNMNTFMDTWVCAAMQNTTYFWFSAFDEPWKHQFDRGGDHWEPYWGIYDVDRKLKDGVKIPSCGGKTVDKPY